MTTLNHTLYHSWTSENSCGRGCHPMHIFHPYPSKIESKKASSNHQLPKHHMDGKNRPLVTDEPVEFERQPVQKFKTLGMSPIILEESIESYLELMN